MRSLLSDFRRRGPFLRRRDLLRLGHTDRDIRAALGARAIFRVRQGWYATPDTPDAAIRAIRVGGKLTGISALASYGLRVPRSAPVSVAVPRNACRLRRPGDKASRLRDADGVRIDWTDEQRLRGDPAQWRMSIDDALLFVLKTESRDVAVACCDAVLRYESWGAARLDAVFAAAPARAQAWRSLVIRNADSHGETLVRLWCADAGIPFEPQPYVTGVGRLDGRIAPHTYVEIDGAQHDELWDGDEPSSFEHDHERDTTMTAGGDRVLRFTYRQLYRDWAGCMAAMVRAIDDDQALSRERARHPYVVPSRTKPRTKRRRSAGRGRKTPRMVG